MAEKAGVLVNAFPLCVKHEFVAQKKDSEIQKQMGLPQFGWEHGMLFLYNEVVGTVVVAKVASKSSNLYARGKVVERMIVSGIGLFYAGVDLEFYRKEQRIRNS